MNKDLIYFAVLFAMLAAMVASIIQWERLNKADRIIAALLTMTVLSEATAYFFMLRVNNNMYVYHVFSPIELSIVSFYFAETVPFFKKWKVGFWVSGIGIAMAFCNAFYLQPISSFPSLFLLFEGFVITILCVFSFFSMLYRDQYSLVNNAQFWITFNLLVFWSFTFLIWGTYNSFAQGLQDKLPIIYDMLTAINFITYINYFIIFLLYKKMVRSGE